MRTTLFTTICAILLGAATLSAQQTTDKYVINGKEIQEVFDGSQLEGLKIESYKIETSTEGKNTVRTHLIKTSCETSPAEYTEPVYVVDGDAVSKADFNKVNTFDIEKIDVIKANADNEIIKRYSAEGKGVIVITLKKEKSKEYKAIGETMRLRNVKDDSYKVVVRGTAK
ncbi:MAG: hypothetical protein IKW99_00610 [Bacteroidales bacterium]|nr:hypothetical protein [Bacteroidales bacterium]